MTVLTLKFLKIIKNLFKFYNSNELKKLQRVDVLFVCADDNLTYMYNGKRYSPLIHSLYEEFERFSFKVGLINRSVSKFAPINIFGKSYIINELVTSFNFLNKYRNWIFGDFKRVAHNPIFSQVEMWVIILERIEPKYIIGIQPPLELCIASNVLNICIADLQHGVLSDEGYYGTKYRDSCNQLGWPNHILCWDAESKEWVNKYIGKYVKSMVIGNPWINRFIFKKQRDQLVNNEFNKFIDKFDNRPIILVSLQYGVDNDNLNFIGIPNGLFEYFKTKGSGFNWFFRIHPIVLNSKSITEINNDFMSYFSGYENVEWLECSKVALPIVLLKTNFHITWSSAVTIEASYFGITTAILSTENLEIFNKLEVKKYVDYVRNDCDEIDKWMLNKLYKKVPNKSIDNSEKFDLINFVKKLNC